MQPPHHTANRLIITPAWFAFDFPLEQTQARHRQPAAHRRQQLPLFQKLKRLEHARRSTPVHRQAFARSQLPQLDQQPIAVHRPKANVSGDGHIFFMPGKVAPRR